MREWVEIYSAPDAVTAELVRGTLEAEGIPAVISDHLAEGQIPSLQIGEGYGGKVCVSAEDSERARQVLSDFAQGRKGVSDEELSEAAERASSPDV